MVEQLLYLFKDRAVWHVSVDLSNFLHWPMPWFHLYTNCNIFWRIKFLCSELCSWYVLAYYQGNKSAVIAKSKLSCWASVRLEYGLQKLKIETDTINSSGLVSVALLCTTFGKIEWNMQASKGFVYYFSEQHKCFQILWRYSNAL